MIAQPKDLPLWGSTFDSVHISYIAHPPPYQPPPKHEEAPERFIPVSEPQPVVSVLEQKKRPIKDISLRPPKKQKCDPLLRAENETLLFKKTVAANMLLMTRWCVDGVVNVKLATENRPRSTAMDVIAIWLGMKLMKEQVLACTNITAARKVVRTHPCFKVGYDFWKKNMITSDDSLKQIFQLEYITPDTEIEEFAQLFSDVPRPEKEEVLLDEIV